MSETPTYFLIAQLFTLMTLALRLSLGFTFLAALALILGKLLSKPTWLKLGGYWTGWLAFTAGFAFLAALGAQALFPYPNLFIQAGLNLALIAGVLGGVLAWVQSKTLRGAGWIGLGLFLFLGFALALPAFSRSDRILLTVVFALPVALCLSYFPLLFSSLNLQARHLFHGLWAISFGMGLVSYHLWLYPQLGVLPREGEFYPYINLYDWFFFGFMILYLGNLYIDYWLNSTPAKVLVLGWNYLVLIVALLCLWFNSSIFDTLAL